MLKSASEADLLRYAGVVLQRATVENAPWARHTLIEDAILVLENVRDREGNYR